MKILSKVALIAIISTSSLFAHNLWINSFESFTHKPGHIIVGLGWGHSIPIDDILNSPNGKIIVEDFSVISPSGKKIDLTIPSSKVKKSNFSNNNFEIFDANIGLQKISLKKNSEKGVYLTLAQSKPTFYTQYIDSKNRTRLKLTTMDKIKNIKKVLMAVKYQAFAKSYFTIGKWSEQKAIGQGLEIIPKTDLSNLHVGDLVEFDVFFYGKPLSVSAKSMEFITAHSNSFGQSSGFSLLSYLQNGKAQFKVQSTGQWIVMCNHKEDVTKDGKLKNLYGKTEQVYHGATLTFNVK